MKELTKTLGRPSEYTEETTDEICRLLSEGRSLKSICEIEGMPDRGSVYNWLIKYPIFFNKYARARDVQADILADSLIQQTMWLV